MDWGLDRRTSREADRVAFTQVGRQADRQRERGSKGGVGGPAMLLAKRRGVPEWNWGDLTDWVKGEFGT